MRPLWLTDTLIGVIVGSLLTTLGSVLLAWINGRSVRKQRFAQLLAEKRLSTLEEAHFLAKTFEGMIGSSHRLKAQLSEFEPWLFRFRPYLPVDFCNKWLELRRDIDLLELAKLAPGATGEDVMKREKANLATVGAMIEDIQRELGMEKLVLRPPIPYPEPAQEPEPFEPKQGT